MNLWRWLTTPDPAPGFTAGKMLKLTVRVVLFALIATLLSGLLQLTPLKDTLNTWWGSLLFVLLLYIPAARFLTLDTFAPRRAPAAAAPGKAAQGSSAQRRKARNRYAGVRKSAPKYGGRR